MNTRSPLRGPNVTEERVGEHFKLSIIASDFFQLMVGEFLGGGVSRGVYGCTIDPSLVVKIETPARSFQNVVEWEAWGEIKDLKLAIRKHFAPCVTISPCGIVMLQKKTTPLTEEELPNRVPAFFTDTKLSNFGWFEGRIVAHDYGLTNLVTSGLSPKMEIADWEIS